MVSFCALQFEIADDSIESIKDLSFNCGRSLDDVFEDLEMSSKPVKPVRSQTLKDHTMGNRQMSGIVVETYSDFADSPVSSSRKASKDTSPGIESRADGHNAEVINFFSGNPFVEVTKGILHLYKENSTTSLEDGVIRSQMICMLGVPAKHKSPDLLQFTAPCHGELEMMRIIQYMDVPNQYMVLLRFRCQSAADEFYQAFNGLAYNSFEPEVCQLVYISKVEMSKESEYYPLSNHTELPVCSICLERMDESISTVLTILCNHTFHSSCLSQWEDASCPVCRSVQTPELVAEQRCSECQSTEDLWICLICGYIGCGRYVGGHSYAHFSETDHSYTMELGQSRVWDYVGDNFVHRLVQTDSADGKLVEADGRDRQGLCCNGVQVDSAEKMDSIQLEYTYLLTSQLESQRRYFEEKISRIEGSAQRDIDEMAARAKASLDEALASEAKAKALAKEKAKAEQKLASMSLKCSKLNADLREEKEMNSHLMQNQRELSEKCSRLAMDKEECVASKDKKIADLEEQMRDVMFYMEAQSKVASSPLKDEIRGGNIEVGEARAKSNSSQSSSNRKKRSGR